MKVHPRILWALAAALLCAAGCGNEEPAGLDEADRPLLEQLRTLAEIRIQAQEQPEAAQSRLDSFLAHTDTTGFSGRVQALWEDPARGRWLLEALHDSLQAPLRSPASPPASARRAAGATGS